MYLNSLYVLDTELHRRQHDRQSTIHHLTRKQRRHERYEVVQPAGDARA